MKKVYDVFIDNEYMERNTFKHIKKEIREFVRWEQKDALHPHNFITYLRAIKELKKNKKAVVEETEILLREV